jgi:outer membrane protein OmpA-like peptidoglycan-associated protein
MTKCLLRFISFFFLILFANPLYSQLYKVSAENADCEGAIQLIRNSYGPTTPPVGPGKIIEISGDPFDSLNFEIEHHTVWYRFKADSNCLLSLDIIPLDINDDYDFILYPYQGENSCRLIAEKKLKPLRSCISRNDTSIRSITGLRKDANKNFINSGPGSSFVRSVQVKKGDEFLLVLDNVYPEGNGHKLQIHYESCDAKTQESPAEPSNYLNINIRNSKTKELIPAEISISSESGFRDSSFTEVFKNTSSIFIKAEQQSKYTVLAKANGYFQSKGEVRTGTDFQTYRLSLELIPIIEGEAISFSNIYFQAGTARILRDSYDVLDDIVETLLDQPGISLKIIGHVNDPLNKRSRSPKSLLMQLSVDRAHAVYKYMLKKGVDSSRLSYEGKSNLEMVYPYARNDEEEQMNRRVEFLIQKHGE